MLTAKEFIDQYCDGDVERYNAILRDGRREAKSWNDLIIGDLGVKVSPTGLTEKEFAEKYCGGDLDRYNAIMRDGRAEAVTWANLLK